MHHPEPLPEPFDIRPFAARAALDLGISRGRLRSADLVTPFHGVRAPIHETRAVALQYEFLERCAAYLQRADTNEFFSHVTAARLYGIPLPLRLQTRVPVDVSVIAPSHPPQSAGVIAHRLARGIPLRSVSGMPCAPPVETWLQLASVLQLDDLIVAGDALVRRKRPLATMDELATGIEFATRRPGLRTARAALPEIRPGTDSPRETLMRLIIVRAGLPEPIIRHTVIDDDGYFVGTPDLAYVRERIALEYEGDGHRSDPQTFREDIERKELFQDARWRYIRVTKDHTDKPDRLATRVRRALADPRFIESGRMVAKLRGWQPFDPTQ